MYAEELTRPVDPADDLRGIWSCASGDELALLARRLPWDCEFFGYGVARLDALFPLQEPWHRPHADYEPPLSALLAEARRRGIRYLLAVVDPREIATLRALGTLGFSLIETRYYHHGPVSGGHLAEDFPIRLATEADIPGLQRAARETINPYDRFHADPYLDPESIARLMEKWVEESVAGRMADVVFVPDVPDPAAFVTYRYQQSQWSKWGVHLAQGVLSAVAPEFIGWMGKLGPAVMNRLAADGVQHSFGSTQVTNRAIIWFAQEAGARFGRCEHVFRILL